jgi:hypothetical protein
VIIIEYVYLTNAPYSILRNTVFDRIELDYISKCCVYGWFFEL